MLAKATGIDAFALNIGTDPWTDVQLAKAYTAAFELEFKLFLSFDFAASPGFTNYTREILPRLRAYALHPAALVWNSRALVSTFAGDGFDWSPVRNEISKAETALAVIPFYAADNVDHHVDGAFNWNAWPSQNNQPVNRTMTTDDDHYYKSKLAGRPYMANVSPWFSTHYGNDTYDRNFLFLSDTLLIDSWNEMLQMQPDLIELATWNDFGESHYIGPLHPNSLDIYAGGPTGAVNWVADMPHDGWRAIIAPYITAYKAGASAPVVPATAEKIVYWYRPSPKDTPCADAHAARPAGADLPADAVFAAALLSATATLAITTSGGPPTTFNAPAGINYFAAPMHAGKPAFTLTRAGKTVLAGTGDLAIRTEGCQTYNFNAFVGVVE